MARITPIKVGPWGGNGGGQWDHGTDYTAIRQITISSGWDVDSILVVYERNGELIPKGRAGGSGGSKEQITLLSPDEYIIGINGYFGKYGPGIVVVRSLTFVSNLQTYGPYGRQQGEPFTLPIHGGRVVSFFGRSGDRLDSIGCYVVPV